MVDNLCPIHIVPLNDWYIFGPYGKAKFYQLRTKIFKRGDDNSKISFFSFQVYDLKFDPKNLWVAMLSFINLGVFRLKMLEILFN